MTRTPIVASTRAELRKAQRRQPRDVGLVMTMGALHAGHAELIRAARQRSRSVVVTIFVNPLQFGPGEDFASYPRTGPDDLALCAREGVDIVFAPPAEEVYRGVPTVTVDPGPLATELEGASRPGHFAGVLTVVHKLLHIVADVDRAYFGEKDYQQLTLLRQMAHDLDLAPEIVGRPTVRNRDGLALSSRNAYLDDQDRQRATALPTALSAGAAAAAQGAPAKAVTDTARSVLAETTGLTVDYLELRAADLTPAPPAGAARLLAAVRVGRTRLIDNVAVTLSPQTARTREP